MKSLRSIFGSVAACLAYASLAQAQPNLIPNQPSGWSARIVVSTSASGTGTSATDSNGLKPTDALFVNWSILNNGSAGITTAFFIAIYIDGTLRHTWNVPPPLDAEYMVYVTNYAIGTLAAGQHTIEVVADSTNVIAESNESDNTCTKIINVGQTAHGRAGAILAPVHLQLPAWTGGRFGAPNGQPLTLEIDPGPGMCAINVPCVWNDVMDVSGGVPPYHFAADTFGNGAPPFGMTIDLSTGAVGGTPTVAGPYNFNVCVIDSAGASNCQPTSITVSGACLVNLTPYQPTGWADMVVVTTSATSTVNSAVDSSPLATSDSLFVDWAVINNGTGDIHAAFFVTLYLDGAVAHNWNVPPPLYAGYFAYALNFAIGSLPAGPHTLEIVADSTNVITECDKSDNTYAKMVVVEGNSNGYSYANWDCNNQQGCIADMGYNLGSAGPFCTADACNAWRNAFFFGATCDAGPFYTIYYGPTGGPCSNYPD